MLPIERAVEPSDYDIFYPHGAFGPEVRRVASQVAPWITAEDHTEGHRAVLSVDGSTYLYRWPDVVAWAGDILHGKKDVTDALRHVVRTDLGRTREHAIKGEDYYVLLERGGDAEPYVEGLLVQERLRLASKEHAFRAAASQRCEDINLTPCSETQLDEFMGVFINGQLPLREGKALKMAQNMLVETMFEDLVGNLSTAGESEYYTGATRAQLRSVLWPYFTQATPCRDVFSPYSCAASKAHFQNYGLGGRDVTSEVSPTRTTYLKGSNPAVAVNMEKDRFVSNYVETAAQESPSGSMATTVRGRTIIQKIWILQESATVSPESNGSGGIRRRPVERST